MLSGMKVGLHRVAGNVMLSGMKDGLYELPVM